MPSAARPPALALLGLLAALACNEGLTPVPACGEGFVGICGTVHFRGPLPDSTQDVVLVAYSSFPQSRNDLFNFVPFPPHSILRSDTVSSYTLGVPNGRYEWVVAVWVKQGFTTANADSTLREAGFYRDPADTTQPGVVTVNGARSGIDIVVDFTTMHPISYYFPAAAPR